MDIESKINSSEFSHLDNIIENTIEWALEHVNNTAYRFMCLGFVEDALERSNQIEIFGGDTAKESADLYQNSMFTGMPCKGSFVFYNCSGEINGVIKNWGHVGLALEEGKVIHAWDKVRIDDYMSIESLGAAPGWEKPQYIGWVPIDVILVGHRTN